MLGGSEIRIVNTKIKLMWKIKYLGSVLTGLKMWPGNSKAYSKSESCLLKTKYSEEEKLLETIKSYVISVFFYGSDCWAVTSQKEIKALEMWFYRRIP